jgi:hypothetical protein
LTHKRLVSTAEDLIAIFLELVAYLASCKTTKAALSYAIDSFPQGYIALPLRGALSLINGLGLLIIVGGGSDRQGIADRLDSQIVSMLVDERDHHFCVRSSFSWADYSDTRRNISLVCLSPRFLHSSSLSRGRSSVIEPGRFSRSLSA